MDHPPRPAHRSFPSGFSGGLGLGAANTIDTGKQCRAPENDPVQTIKYVHWQEGDVWLGYLQDYPDYWTQGESLDDLIEHLRDLYLDLSGGHVPGVRKVGELVVP